ncbi:MAG: hypothetical protein PHW91_02920 [Bacteroidales bacterium]|nr:hypothetical protein [Bacteroidales bacterium]
METTVKEKFGIIADMDTGYAYPVDLNKPINKVNFAGCLLSFRGSKAEALQLIEKIEKMPCLIERHTKIYA